MNQAASSTVQSTFASPRSQVEKSFGIVLTLVLLFVYAYFFPRWADWNQNTRLNLTLALVETGSIAIDPYHENTGDKLYYQGHYYSDKAPGLSFAAVPIYAVMHPILNSPPIAGLLDRLGSSPSLAATLNPDGSGVSREKIVFAAAQYLFTVLLVSLPSALLGLMLFRFMARFIANPWPRLGLALAYGLGTPALPYSTVFYSHQLGAVLTFAAFFLVYRIRWEAAPRWHLWLAGALLGFSIMSENPTLIMAAAIGLYAVFGLRDWKAGLPLALSALPFILLWLGYNYARFGDALELGYQYHATFTAHAQAGPAGFAGFRWQALWDITFSPYKGLFFRSPFLLLALPAFLMFWQQKRWRLELITALVIVVLYFFHAASFYDWGGGHTAGPRYLVAMLPFMTFPLALVVSLPVWRWLFAALASISVLLINAEAMAGQHFPYQEMRNPWTEYILPSWQNGDIARNLGTVVGLSSWYSLIPLVLVLGVAAWILFKGLNQRLHAA
jgi:hypothetical protein